MLYFDGILKDYPIVMISLYDKMTLHPIPSQQSFGDVLYRL